MNTESNSENTATGVIKILMKDPAIKVVVIVAGTLAVVYLLGFAFKIASGTIREYKGLNAAIRM